MRFFIHLDCSVVLATSERKIIHAEKRSKTSKCSACRSIISIRTFSQPKMSSSIATLYGFSRDTCKNRTFRADQNLWILARVILLLKTSGFAGFLRVILGRLLATRISSQFTGGWCASSRRIELHLLVVLDSHFRRLSFSEENIAIEPSPPNVSTTKLGLL